MTFKLMMATAASAALLTGCGGGGSSAGNAGSADTLTGTFQDAIVENLGYKCTSGTEGVTTDAGSFTCNTGDEVEFFVGEYSLGKVAMKAGVTTPYSLYPADVTAAVNVARILQTIDATTGGTIVIPNAFTGLNAVTGTTPDAGNFNAIVVPELPDFVTAAVATEHMVNSLLGGSQWHVVETISGNCPGETVPYTDSYTLGFVNFNITNSSATNTITVQSANAGQFTGNYNAITETITASNVSYPQDGGTTTINTLSLTPNTSFEVLTGNSTWSWTGGPTTCTGTTTVTATWL
jgi:hypothetical protein